MSEVDLPGRLDRYDGEVTIRRIALTKDDLADLPIGFPVSDKKSDPRYQWWIRNGYGDTCWELDAMDPNVLRDRVEDQIRAVIDREAWELSQKVEEAELATIDHVCGNWRKLISGKDRK